MFIILIMFCLQAEDDTLVSYLFMCYEDVYVHRQVFCMLIVMRFSFVVFYMYNMLKWNYGLSKR